MVRKACLKNGQHVTQKILMVFLVSLYPEFLEKKNKEIKKLIFGQFSLFLFCLPWKVNVGWKKEKTWIFVYSSIDIFDKHVTV